jgi:hypothetical protein
LNFLNTNVALNQAVSVKAWMVEQNQARIYAENTFFDQLCAVKDLLKLDPKACMSAKGHPAQSYLHGASAPMSRLLHSRLSPSLLKYADSPCYSDLTAAICQGWDRQPLLLSVSQACSAVNSSLTHNRSLLLSWRMPTSSRNCWMTSRWVGK